MAAITVRNVDEQLKARLRVRAAHNARSMEEEVRIILRDAVLPEAKQTGLGSRLHKQILDAGGGVNWQAEPRHIARKAPDFNYEDKAE